MSGTSDLRQISVFIASPGDLAPERKRFKETLDALNKGFADGAGVRFNALGWEDVLAETGRRTQSVINKEIEKADVFVLVLRRRWGQAAEDSTASSYTEEEFNVALDLWRKGRKPEILVFFKTIDSDSLSDPGPQLMKVLAFRKKLTASKAVMIRSFGSEGEFADEIDRHLRAYAKGAWNDLNDLQQNVTFPEEALQALAQAQKKNVRQNAAAAKNAAAPGKKRRKGSAPKLDLTLAKAHETDLTLALAALDAAKAEKLQEARILFAKATEATTDIPILSVAAEFFKQVNDLESSGRLVRRIAALSKDAMVAARYYMATIPQEVSAGVGQAVMEAFAKAVPPEALEEMATIVQEVLQSEAYRESLADALAHFYTEEELISLADFMASPVGQSTVQKQVQVTQALMEVGGRLMQQALREKYPEEFAEVPTASAELPAGSQA